jgi:hypothetical protein
MKWEDYEELRQLLSSMLPNVKIEKFQETFLVKRRQS